MRDNNIEAGVTIALVFCNSWGLGKCIDLKEKTNRYDFY